MHIYNSLSGRKEEFKPMVPGQVGLYVCGVTVYDLCHIGHARTYATFDTLVRYLRLKGLKVTYVRNITDVDDKIIKRAAERNVSVEALVDQNIAEMYADFDALHLLRPDVEPRAMQTISEMLQLIEELIAKGFAYAPGNGDVYYEVTKFKDYGKLSKQNLEALRAGSRVEVNTVKKSPLDFVLWKAAKPGEVAWESPWGKGRPGWHIECSAMTRQCLGPEFDIHGGGSDLRFPHHENEIAQSEAVDAGKFARYWMHSGMVQVNNEKMSKSLGNFFVIRDVLKEYPAEVVRYFLMSGHYRSEISYSTENLNAAKSALDRLYNALRNGESIDEAAMSSAVAFKEKFMKAMDDDLNTPEALAVLFELAKAVNKTNNAELKALLKTMGGLLGILQQNPEAYFQAGVDVAAVEELVAERKLARQNKDFAASDRIRDELKAMGIELEDTADGTVWRVA